MRHIIFVENLNTDEDRNKITSALDNTRLDYTISTITQSVTVEGSNDAVYTAKQAIQQAGYEIQ